ncbi:MAG: DnaJ family domain-containing protein [Chloroflexaceae bacterium]
MRHEPAEARSSEEQSAETRAGPAPFRANESLIERRVREAAAAGMFENLPGAGQPLRLDNDAHVPEDLRPGYRLLKNAGYAPAWIELHKHIRTELADLEGWLASVTTRWAKTGPLERERLRAEYAQKVRDLNRQITTYNLIAPPAAGQLPLRRPGQELAD